MNIIETSSTEEIWLMYKSFIEQKYLVEDMSLKELLRLLHDGGLSVTKSQMEYKLKLWKFHKNVKQETWRSIARKIKRRERMGKNSEVMYNGKSNIVAEQRSPSPASSILVVSTPRAVNYLFAWPETLPWLQIRDIFSDSNIFTPGIPGSNAILAVPYGESLSTILKDVFNGDSTRRRSAFPGLPAAIWDRVAFSNLSVALQTTMPEWYMGDRAQTVDALTTDSRSGMLPTFLRAIAYSLSNARPLIERREIDAFSSILTSALRNNNHSVRLLRNKHITVRAFFETVFKMEIQQATFPPPGERLGFAERSLDLIRLLLNLGQDADLLVSGRSDGHMEKPIQTALQCGHLDLVRLLLHFHAFIDEGKGPSAVQSILRNGLSEAEQLRLLKALDQYNAISPEQLLCGAIQLGDALLVEQMLKKDIDVTKTHRETPLVDNGFFKLDSYIGCESPLTVSMGNNNLLFQRLLTHPPMLRNPAYLTSPEFFIFAAMRGDPATMEYLLNLWPSGLTCQGGHLAPLTAAVAYHNLPVVQFLLERQAEKSSHLIFIAASLGNEDMLHLLLRYRVPLNKIGRSGLQSLDCFDHFYIRRFQRPEGVIEMLMSEGWHKQTASHANCLTTLIQAGAQFTGGDILDMAEFRLFGPLEAALSSGGNPNERDFSGRTAIQCCLDPFGIIIPRPSYTGLGIPFERQQTIRVLLEGGAKLVGGEVGKSIREHDMDLTTLLLEYSCRLCMIDQDETYSVESLIMTGPIHGGEEINDFLFLRSLIESQGGAINVGALCAAMQQENWQLVDHLLLYPYQKSKDCHILEGTAIGLAAKRAG
ncbi:Sex-determining fem-1 [Fusarium mexicanum]|uniref:Sex-determining fem-1 n=1 Tax=Fusarium mexicanum TaxID=751941 RepID=A0A8H5JFY3_9HYPO|nr:Sex-determining fem-1 [Fusarium mexicanum]